MSKKKLDLRDIKKEAETPKVEEKALTPREIDFSFDYIKPDGDTQSVTLKSRVLDGEGRMVKMRVLSALTRDLYFDALPLEDRSRLEALSRCTAQLVDPPKWVRDTLSEDNEVLIGIHNILVEHETRYFRSGLGQGEEAVTKKRVSFVVSAFED